MTMTKIKIMKLLSHHHRVSFKTFRHVLRYGNVNTYSVMIPSPEKKVGQPKPTTENQNSVSLNAAVQDLCRKSRMSEAMVMFEKINRTGLAPDKRTYMALFHMFCRQFLYEQAYKLLTEMVVRGFSPSVSSFNKLIRRYCSEGTLEELEEALWILRGMPEMGLSPDAVSYATVISGFCRIRKPMKAYELKLEMVDKGILPKFGTYSQLIDYMYQHGRLSEAFDLFREMLRAGVWRHSPDKYYYLTGNYSKLMHAYCDKGEISKAFLVHDEMIHNGIFPDAHKYSKLIQKLCLYRRLSEALYFFREMLREGVWPRHQDNKFEEALGILRGMADMDLSPDVVSYGAIISGFCRNRELGRAFELKLEMKEKDIYGMDRAVYSSLMQGLSDEVTYTSLINAYCAKGEVDKARTLLLEMKVNGYLSDSDSELE
ncbi:pentatricopeptide repeat-containing protein At5g39710-like isoform X1 [Lotus japonicus]|uniref:pentatricopeptide repeat-containing protein At5g39710-like isoform X1 n=1 Tax=Lotus japonicus TaxID=34305 RepID=UPI00258AE186|nr:pentatricopeptide repeat-containing protein At5g39710-like isoform X1 [Lotus japonicus]